MYNYVYKKEIVRVFIIIDYMDIYGMYIVEFLIYKGVKYIYVYYNKI